MAPRKPTNVGTEEVPAEVAEEVVETPVAEVADATPDAEIPDAAPEGDEEAPAPDADEAEEDEAEEPSAWVITAPDNRTATVARVRFEDGVGRTTDPTRVAFFERRGWGVEEV